MNRRRITNDKKGKDIHDLVAAIITQARYEWQAPNQDDQRAVCEGDDLLGHEQCMFYSECYYYHGHHGHPSGQRYRECLHRRSANRQELLRFFFSSWFEFLLGGIEPALARKAMGISEKNNTCLIRQEGGKYES